MRLFRFGAQLTGTAFFIVGLFALPVIFALVRQSIEVRTQVAQDEGEVRVVHWEPEGGGGRDVPDASNEGNDPVETGEDAPSEVPQDLAASPSGTPIPGRTSASPQGRASSGSGSGQGGGTGRITMYRPAGHDRATRPRGGSAQACDPAIEGIRALSEGEYQVDKEVIDEYANLRRAQELVGWIDRYRDENGKFNGVQVGGIKCGSPLHLAGIRSGDVLHSVNGVEITGIPSALAAVRKLKRSDRVEIRITRSGGTMRVVYHVS